MNLNINFTQPISNLNPTHCIGTNEVNICSLLFRSLYVIEKNQVLTDLVKKDHHNEDFTNWQIEIHPFMWSDGSEGSISDLVNTWKFAIKENLAHFSFFSFMKGYELFKCGEATEIEGLIEVNKYTLRIVFTRPLPYLRELLTNIHLSPVKVPDSPYTMADFVTGVPLITNHNCFIDRWTKDQVTIKSTDQNDIRGFSTYRFTFTQDYQAIHTRFLEGTLQIHDGGTNKDCRFLDKYMKHYDFLSTYYLFFNTLNEDALPLTMRNKMKAAIHLKRDFITGTDKVQSDKLVPLSLRNWKDRKKHGDLETIYRGDVCKQERELKFICNDEGAYIDLSKRLIEVWREELGLNIKLEVLSWDDFFEALTSRSFDIARAGWVADFAHPHSFFEVLTSNSSSNFSGWNNEEYDRLYSQSAITYDPEARKNLYERMDDLIERDTPVLPLYEHKLRQLVHPDIHYYDVSHTGVINYKSTSISVKGGENYEKDRCS